jgi:sugar/nucleoside kinase (ribokinase family)
MLDDEYPWTGDLKIKPLPTLMVIGDALRDTYLIGEWSSKNEAQRFKPNDRLRFLGGAANTHANAKQICGDKARVISWTNFKPLELFRLVGGSQTLEVYTEAIHHYSLNLPPAPRVKVTGIVISDYNKGTVNRWAPECALSADWLIVDSRYRSVHPTWLECAPFKIWRCTGDEYDAEWAKQFDLIVHTDASKSVCVCRSDGTIMRDFPVPQIAPIDTCGAGDTFTAALASYLLLGREASPIYILSLIHI